MNDSASIGPIDARAAPAMQQAMVPGTGDAQRVTPLRAHRCRVEPAGRIDRMMRAAKAMRRCGAVVRAVAASLCCWLAVAAFPATAAQATASGAAGTPAASAALPPAASAASGASPAAAAPLPTRHPPLSPADAARATHDAIALRASFAHDVTRRLRVPPDAQRAYGARLQQALAARGLADLAGEYVVLVDRAPNVQALFLYFRATRINAWVMIGASPVATGLPGEYDHFLTPLGVFEHTPANMDFRAEGTTNENGIRGYGRRDLRIYDFGWVDGERGWGKGGTSEMRLQMHATDPDRLEPLLGIRHSKGCVRMPASLDVFLDRRGILDAEYDALVESGKSLWVLHLGPETTPWAGRYVAVIDSARKQRPAWAPPPARAAWARMPKGGDTAD